MTHTPSLSRARHSAGERASNTTMATQALPKHQAILREVVPGARVSLLHAIRILEVAQRPLTLDELTSAMFVDYTSWRFVSHQSQADIRQLLKPGRIFESTTVPWNDPDTESTYWDEGQGVYCVHALTLSQRLRQDLSHGDSPKVATWMAQAHALMARICLIYLMNCDPPSAHGAGGSHSQAMAAYAAGYQMQQWRQEHLLATYAAKYWPIHAYLGRSGGASNDGDLARAELALLASPEHTDCWLRIYDAAERETQIAAVPRRYGWMAPHSALFHAAFHGLETATQSLVERALAAPTVDTSQSFDEALQAAALRGHSAVVERLLAQGADPNSAAGPFASALVAGAAGGSATVLSALFAGGAMIPMHADQQHPLVVAANCGHADAVSLLAGTLGITRQGVLDYALADALGRAGPSEMTNDVIRVLMELGARGMV
ncbi:hypothetical protein GQ53DRAFT_454265 [Thozetella sp. PMI_491]|nr:hypothetical protein GQ53DRAFT_454265 [Thozetella sp. PMI_491]